MCIRDSLYGMYHPEEGQILVNGTPTPFRGPNDAIAAGVGMVHQHFMLADNFTVLENIILGSEPQSRGRLDIDELCIRDREVPCPASRGPSRPTSPLPSRRPWSTPTDDRVC